MAERYWPLEAGRILTSPFGMREGGFHFGADFGFPGGSGGKPVFAIQAGAVKYCGSAQGYGGPDPNGWIVIESSSEEGGGCLEYGHIRRLPHIKVGVRVRAGEQIAIINPDPRTNGAGTAPHLHLSDMPGAYDPSRKQDPLPRLAGAKAPVYGFAHKEENVARPDFNEYWVPSTNNEDRRGTPVDLFLLHTQEGGTPKNGADALARWLQGPVGVSYHYTVSQDPDDGGVTVCDVVSTTRASWSVLSANRRSINLVFAGSRADWSREQWMKQSKAIDVAAFIAVRDAKKHGFNPRVLAPPYNSNPPGISDHNYVTKWLRDGTHTDVGKFFPWDYFAERVAFHSSPTAPAKPDAPTPVGPADDQLTLRWNCLGGQTVVEALAEVRDKVLGTDDRNKTGVKTP